MILEVYKMGLPEREHLPNPPSDKVEFSQRPSFTLTELHSRWLTQRRESWQDQEEKLRNTVLLMTGEQREKERGLKSLYGTNALFDEEGYLYVIQWQTLTHIKKPELYTILWPPWVRDERMTAYLEEIPKQRRHIARAKLVRIRGLEEAIRFTGHVRESYLPEEGEVTQRTRNLIAQIKRLSATFARPGELTPSQIQELTAETRDLIESSDLISSRLPRVLEAVDRVWRATTMKDRTGRLNPTACRQMLFSALIELTLELEMKYPQIQRKYSSFEATWRFERAQERWVLRQTKDGLSHFLQSAVYRHPYLLGKMTERQLQTEKQGMAVHLVNTCQELESQIKLRPYKPVAQGVILGLHDGEGYREAGWHGDSAVELIANGYFGRAERRINFCIRRIAKVLEEFESIEKKEEESPDRQRSVP